VDGDGFKSQSELGMRNAFEEWAAEMSSHLLKGSAFSAEGSERKIPGSGSSISGSGLTCGSVSALGSVEG